MAKVRLGQVRDRGEAEGGKLRGRHEAAQGGRAEAETSHLVHTTWVP